MTYSMNNFQIQQNMDRQTIDERNASERLELIKLADSYKSISINPDKLQIYVINTLDEKMCRGTIQDIEQTMYRAFRGKKSRINDLYWIFPDGLPRCTMIKSIQFNFTHTSIIKTCDCTIHFE